MNALDIKLCAEQLLAERDVYAGEFAAQQLSDARLEGDLTGARNWDEIMCAIRDCSVAARHSEIVARVERAEFA